MTQLVETEAGLVVPETALPPKPSMTDLNGTFDSKEAAEKWVAHCDVRWRWAVRMIHLKANYPDEEPRYRAEAYRLGGQIHDTTAESYVKSEDVTNDNPLTPYVEIVKEKTTDENRPTVYRVVNKF
jgi:hypothetical protein